MKLLNVLTDFNNGLSTILFPPMCKGCGNRINTTRQIFCEKCWNSLSFMSDTDISKKEIPGYIDDIFIVYQFDDMFQTIIHALKYQNNPSIGIRLGYKMSKVLQSKIKSNDRYILIPIPLHPIKKRERGYNQAETIGLGLRNGLDMPIFTKVIKRVKNTSTQTQLNAEERKENMKNAFNVTGRVDLIRERYVALVDDVFTTGSTMSSAAQVLHENGIERIIAVTAGAPV